MLLCALGREVVDAARRDTGDTRALEGSLLSLLGEGGKEAQVEIASRPWALICCVSVRRREE